MSEALARRAVPQAREAGAGTRLIELLDRDDPEAVNEAAALTFEMATEVAEWSDGSGAKVKRWWVEQYRLKLGDQGARDCEEAWGLAEVEAEVKVAAAAAKRERDKGEGIAKAEPVPLFRLTHNPR